MSDIRPSQGARTVGGMFLGLRSHILPAADLAAAKAFYTSMLGLEPYFDEPFYAGYDVGGFELGLWPAGEHASTYWGVDDLDAALARVVALGAVQRGDISEVGGGIRMADVESPTGDAFGLIENPNFVAAAPPPSYAGPGR
jgi:predicted enzyme related to lactoylglutathione lyase